MTAGLEAGMVGRDEASLCRFYRDVMGFTLVERLAFAVGVVCRLRRGDARMKIYFPADAVETPTAADPWFRPGGWRYAALAVDAPEAVDGLAAAMVAAGGREILPPTDHRPGARMAMITDPEGNAWELLADTRAAGEDDAP